MDVPIGTHVATCEAAVFLHVSPCHEISDLHSNMGLQRTPQEHINADIAQKTALRDAIEAQLQQQVGSCRDLERECAALVSKARHTSGKLMVSGSMELVSCILICCGKALW